MSHNNKLYFKKAEAKLLILSAKTISHSANQVLKNAVTSLMSHSPGRTRVSTIANEPGTPGWYNRY